MDALIQQLGNLLKTEMLVLDHPVNVGQIVVLIVILAVSLGCTSFLRQQFRKFLKGALLTLVFPIVMIIGVLLGLRIAGIKTELFSKILHYPLADLLFPVPETETQVSGMDRLTLVDLFYGFVVVSVTLILSKYGQSLLDRHVNIKENNKAILKRLLHYAFVTLGALISLNIIGISLTNLAIALGGMGIGIGIGLQNVASNLIARLIIFLEKPIKNGDLVELREQNLFGRVEKIDLCSTVIVSLDEKTIIIPNSQLTTDSIHNLTYENNLFQLRITIGVPSNSDVAVVKEALIEAAHEHPGVIKKPSPEMKSVTSPLVRFIRLEESSLDFELLVWISDSFQRFDIASDLYFKVWEKFKANKISIAFLQGDTDYYSTEEG